jgi:hypothetical protein
MHNYIGKLLCRLGLHKWRYFNAYFEGGLQFNNYKRIITEAKLRKCTRCGVEQYHNGYDWETIRSCKDA